MARLPSPWRRRGENGDWYAWIQGKCVWLAPAGVTKTQARAALTERLAETATGRTRRTGLLVRDMLNLFLASCEAKVSRGELEAVTLEGYERYLIPAREALGRHHVAALKPAHVTAWLDSRAGWKATSRYNAITALKRACNWARREGHIPASPLTDMPRPTPARREQVLTPTQVEQLLAAIGAGNPFRVLLEALRETGCRPGEACRLTADRVDLSAGTWTVSNKTRRATGEQTRTVYLSDRARTITRELIERHPSGHVFLNVRGRPWTRNAIALRMGRLGKRLGFGGEAVAYSLRHDFATTALERGVAPATVAELLGHRSLTMVMRIYNRLSSRTEHLRAAVNQVRQSGGK